MTACKWIVAACAVALGACGDKAAPPARTEGKAVATVSAPAAPAPAEPGLAPAVVPEPGAAALAPTAAAPASEAVTSAAAMVIYDLPKLQEEIRASGATVTVVALWATWCMPCIEEMPVLDAFYAQHRAEGLRVVGLCTDDRADMAEKIQGVLDRAKVSYRQALLTPGGEDAFFKGVGQQWDGQLPKTVVFDAKGELIAFFASAVTTEALAAKVAPLFAK